MRPFVASAGVHCRAYSLGLQRVMADFGADDSFQEAVKKVREHYGIEVPESGVRVITESHAQTIQEQQQTASHLPGGGVARVIAETDRSFVPVVKLSEGATGDKRKTRRVDWREARLSVARLDGAVAKHYNATLESVDEAGAQLLDCVIAVGGGTQTKVHCVGDGATWIVRQVLGKVGSGASYLIDFYHLSEYLAQAGEAITGWEKDEWVRCQQQRMKENRVGEVLAELKPHLEGAEPEAGQAATGVRACDRYIRNRIEYLDYQGALKAGLPIGSGEVESGHRTVIQARLKISGAWWKEGNAEKMLRLRVCRANGEWESYWERVRQAAA